MKPPPFAYADPDTLDQALELLAEAGDDAAIIAGGQSLIPLLNLRLARPELVIDLRRVDGLDRIELTSAGLLAGPMARVADVEDHPSIGAMPGLAEVLGHIGHSQIRARTTIAGSIAHADPAAELPALLLAADGEVTLQSRERGTRVVPASELFLGPLMTARAADELITSVWFPAVDNLAIAEVAKRHGDFAIIGAIAGYGIEQGAMTDPRIVLFGVAGTAIRMTDAEAELQGRAPEPDAFAAAASTVRRVLAATDDAHGSADYRRHVAAVLVERTLGAAA